MIFHRFDKFLQTYLVFVGPPPRHGKVKVNFDGFVKSESVDGAGILCQNERGIVLLAKGWMLDELIVSLIELVAAREVIRVAFFELYAQSIWFERDFMVMIR